MGKIRSIGITGLRGVGKSKVVSTLKQDMGHKVYTISIGEILDIIDVQRSKNYVDGIITLQNIQTIYQELIHQIDHTIIILEFLLVLSYNNVDNYIMSFSLLDEFDFSDIILITSNKMIICRNRENDDVKTLSTNLRKISRQMQMYDEYLKEYSKQSSCRIHYINNDSNNIDYAVEKIKKILKV